MKILDRVAKRMGYQPTPPARSKRGFNISQTSLGANLATWSRSNTSMDYDLNRSLGPLRAFARDLTVNSAIGRRFMQLVATHVVGPTGFSFAAKPRQNNGKLDVTAAIAIKAAWELFCTRGTCDVTGKLSMTDIDQINIKALARDGEFIVREIIGSGLNEFNYSLQLLDTDRLDINFNNLKLPNGNQVIMGVEVTPYQRPVAYHLLRSHPGGSNATYLYDKHERVPASELHHVFIQERAEQTRGIPWMHAVMSDTKNLAGFTEAAIIASRVGASKMGFFTSPDGSAEAISDGVDGDDQFYTDVEPGKFGVLPAGYTFENFNPDYPNQMVESFLKSAIRQIASGIGVSYHTLSSDLEGVNFSSARAGTLEERDEWMRIQSLYIQGFKIPAFSTWLRYALLSGQIKLPNGRPLPAENYTKFNQPYFNGRRWSWVDPVKDVTANTQALTAKITSHTRILASQGMDLRELWQELADEEALAKELGVTVPAFTAPAPPPTGGAPEPPKKEEVEPKKESPEED